MTATSHDFVEARVPSKELKKPAVNTFNLMNEVSVLCMRIFFVVLRKAHHTHKSQSKKVPNKLPDQTAFTAW